MDYNEYHESGMKWKEYQQWKRKEALEREQMRLDMRTNVLATIDELNQFLLGNVTIEAATDAARELAYQLNYRW